MSCLSNIILAPINFFRFNQAPPLVFTETPITLRNQLLQGFLKKTDERGKLIDDCLRSFIEPREGIQGVRQALEKGEKELESILPSIAAKCSLQELMKEIPKGDKFKSVVEHAKEECKYLRLPASAPALSTNQSRSGIVNFFTTFIDTFMTAFNFFDGSEPPTSIYEKHVLIQIYFRFFQIPIAIALLLQPIFHTAWRVYSATMAILGAVSAAIFCYSKLRPFPSLIPHCKRIEDIPTQHTTLIRGLDTQMGDVVTNLNQKNPKPLMFVGKTGTGKTTLMYKISQRLHRPDCPACLKGKKIVVLNGGQLMAKSEMGFGDKVKEIKASLAGFEKETLIFIDELQAITQSRACFELIKDLVRTTKFQFITATTQEGFNQIKQADSDNAFRKDFKYINFDKADEDKGRESVKSILQEKALLETGDIAFNNDVLDKIIELTDRDIPEIPQPGKSIDFLNHVIATCRTNYSQYQPKDLPIKKLELEGLQCQYAKNFSSNDQTIRKEMERLNKEIHELEKIQKEHLTKAAALSQIIKLKNHFKQQLIKDSFELAACAASKKNPSEELQKRYLLNYFYLMPTLQKLEEQSLEQAKEMNLEVNIPFVVSLFKDYKEIMGNVLKS